MPDAGKKRSYDEEDEPSGKKTRGDGDSKDSAVHVYQPCVVLPELAGKMNSLVELEVCPVAVALCTPATTWSHEQCVSDAVNVKSYGKACALVFKNIFVNGRVKPPMLNPQSLITN